MLSQFMFAKDHNEKEILHMWLSYVQTQQIHSDRSCKQLQNVMCITENIYFELDASILVRGSLNAYFKLKLALSIPV